MNLKRLYEILGETTHQLRKGPQIETRQVGPVEVVEVFNMPHTDAPEVPADLVKIDVVFMIIGVDKAAAEKHRAELIEILATYPNPARLEAGPSYIEVGAEIGDQGAAFCLFALGEVLGLWRVITPTRLGMKDENEARELAGRGLIMISPYNTKKEYV